jgi:predicted anti-sigma-YlaC factor YlaD
MKCKDLLGFVTDYIHDEATTQICRELEDHMAHCERCRLYVDHMKTLVYVYRDWRDQTCPRDVSARLRKAIAEEAKRGSAGKKAPRSGPSPGRRGGRR